MNTDIRTSVMPRTGPVSSSIARAAASRPGIPCLDIPRDALDDDDRVVDDDADREHDGEQGRED